MKLLLCQYNNYFNRRIKTNYDYTTKNYAIIPNVNFKNNDGVTTTQVINWDKDWTPDYLLVLDDNTVLPDELYLDPVLMQLDVNNIEYVDEMQQSEYYIKTDKSLIMEAGKFAASKDPSYEGDVKFDLELNNVPIKAVEITTANPDIFRMTVSGENHADTMDFNVENPITYDRLIDEFGWPENEEIFDIATDVFAPGVPINNMGTINVNIVDQKNFPIESRWFIKDSLKNRKGQYTLSLKRDVVADDYKDIEKHLCNIIRAQVPASNPLIFNKEPFTYNQIKKSETYLYDETMCPWIVGYIANGTDISPEPLPGDEVYDLSIDQNVDQWEYWNLKDTTILVDPQINDTRVPIAYERNFWVGGFQEAQAHQGPGWSNMDNTATGTNNQGIRYSESNYNKCKNAERQNWVDWNYLNTLIYQVNTACKTNTFLANLRSYNGLKIRFNDGIYKVNITDKGPTTIIRGQMNKDHGVEFWKHGVKDKVTEYLMNCFSVGMDGAGSVKHDDKCAYDYKVQQYAVSITLVPASNTITYKIPSGVNMLTDAPYTMFCMPYPEATAESPVIKIGKNNTFNAISKETINRVYSDIISKTITGASASNLYDVQILPYCPMKFTSASYLSDGSNKLTMDPNWEKNKDYTEIVHNSDSGEKVIGYIFFPKESSFKFTISKCFRNNSNHYLYNEYRTGDVKIGNETEFIRFCSPNYSGTFEMVPAKNGGLNSVQVLCTYKPYNPYIQVQPEFNSLYGQSFEDSRGLVCTGDFSLPIKNDAWVNYELTNKTYQQTFNREVQHMEVSQDIARQQQVAKAITGTITGAVSGATTGAIVGGGAGAAAGALAGGVTSAIGGGIDYSNLVKQQKEDINYSKDMFNFQLQNIKALPSSLAKTSSLNVNSKYVPFIEFYSATDEEKELLKLYLEYNGMTAGFCGNIDPQKFVQANIIKYEGELEPQAVNELNNELLKGVYFE